MNKLAVTIGKANTEGEPKVEDTRDPGAVAFGQEGGLKGGKARATRATPGQRAEMAPKPTWLAGRHPNRGRGRY